MRRLERGAWAASTLADFRTNGPVVCGRLICDTGALPRTTPCRNTAVNASPATEKPRPPLPVLIAFMWGAYFLNYCDRQAVFAMFKVLKADLAMVYSETD